MRWAGCGEPHIVFANEAVYIPPEAAPEFDRKVREELGDLGLLRGGRLTDEFADTLHLFDKPEQEFFAFVRTGDEQYSILVAARNRAAAVALHQGDRVWLKPDPTPNQAATLVEHLPEFDPAGFTPFTVARQDLRDAENGGSDIYDEPARTSPEARELLEIFSVPYYGAGFLHAARRDHRGRREQASETVKYLDIDAGRVTFAESGGDHIAVLPGTPVNLANKLAALAG
ncbi:ESX secretion-associated protein EspG [Amycolatopsis suaedae]|nr:ESX secretion-associated protein EspG [Amycolatopsis suaedae]